MSHFVLVIENQHKITSATVIWIEVYAKQLLKNHVQWNREHYKQSLETMHFIVENKFYSSHVRLKNNYNNSWMHGKLNTVCLKYDNLCILSASENSCRFYIQYNSAQNHKSLFVSIWNKLYDFMTGSEWNISTNFLQ